MTTVDRRRGQRGMTMLETLLALMLSVLMVVPVVGWGAVAMRQQRDVVERNLSGASLGVLRTLFTRDVVNADRAWVAGAHLDDCRIRTDGARTLLVLVTGDRHTVYATVPDPAQDAVQLVRAQCPKAGTTALAEHELLSDVVGAGTSASCETADDLAALGVADATARAAVVAERALRDAFGDLGIDYRAAIAKSTSARLREQYRFPYRKGEVIEAEEHIALGGTYDPRRCLRIYFSSRVPNEPRFVIAHVGRHFEVMTTT